MNAPFIKRRVVITEYDCKKPKITLGGSKTTSLASISSKLEPVEPIIESTATQVEAKAEIETKKAESKAEISNDSIKSEPIKQQQQIKDEIETKKAESKAEISNDSTKSEQINPEIQTSTLTSIETEKKETIQSQPIQITTNQIVPKQESFEEKITKKLEKYELNQNNINELQLLKNFKVVFIIDDSTSMNKVLEDSPLNNDKTFLKVTRWDELIYFTNISIEIASLFSSDGSDVYFLNRFDKPIKNIKEFSQLSEHFKDKPNGTTPLTKVLNQVLKDNSGLKSEETNLLVVIVTDGEPTNNDGYTDIVGFQNCLNNRSDNVFTNIIACTDEDETMDYLKDWDKMFRRLAIIDDYRTERNEIKKRYGQKYSFSFGDYVIKSLISSIYNRQIEIKTATVTESATTSIIQTDIEKKPFVHISSISGIRL